jgi:hypothetical protein
MTQKELEIKIKNEYTWSLPQYKKAAKQLLENGYIVIANYDYTARVYRLTVDNEIETIATDISKHRAKQVIKAINSGIWDTINADVRENYCTNGYTTRRGLFADYTPKLERIQRIAQSHIEVIDSGKEAHELRVELRNKQGE